MFLLDSWAVLELNNNMGYAYLEPDKNMRYIYLEPKKHQVIG